MHRARITAYVFGSCWTDHGPGGWASVLLWHGRTKELSGRHLDTCSRKMSMQALISTVALLTAPTEINVVTNFPFLRMTKERWKYIQEHPAYLDSDLWRELFNVCTAGNHRLTFTIDREFHNNEHGSRAIDLADEQTAAAIEEARYTHVRSSYDRRRVDAILRRELSKLKGEL